MRVTGGVSATAGLVVRLGIERRRHQRIVLRAEVLFGPPERGVSVPFSSVGRGQIVLTLELREVADGHLQLVRDPRIGASLTHPGSDLVQLGLQGPARHGRGNLPTRLA